MVHSEAEQAAAAVRALEEELEDERRRLLRALDEQRAVVLAAAASASAHAQALADVRRESEAAVLAVKATAADVERDLQEQLAAQQDGAMEAATEAAAEIATAALSLADADADISRLLGQRKQDRETAQVAIRQTLQAQAELKALALQVDEAKAASAAAEQAAINAREEANIALSKHTAAATEAETAAEAVRARDLWLQDEQRARRAECVALTAALADADEAATRAVEGVVSARSWEASARESAAAYALAAEQMRSATDIAVSEAMGAVQARMLAERAAEAAALRSAVAEAEAETEALVRLVHVEAERANKATETVLAAREAAKEAAIEAGREAAETVLRHAQEVQHLRERAEVAEDAAAVAKARADVAESSMKIQAASHAEALAAAAASASKDREALMTELDQTLNAQLEAARDEATATAKAVANAAEAVARRREFEAGLLSRELWRAEELTRVIEHKRVALASQVQLNVCALRDATLLGETSASALSHALAETEASAAASGAREMAALAAADDAKSTMSYAGAALESLSRTLADMEIEAARCVADATAEAATVAALEAERKELMEARAADLERHAVVRSEASAIATKLSQGLSKLKQLEMVADAQKEDHAAAMAAITAELTAANARAKSSSDAALALRAELKHAEETQAELQADAAWRLAEAAEAAEAAGALARREAQAACAGAAQTAKWEAETGAEASRIVAAAVAAVTESELCRELAEQDAELRWADNERAALHGSLDAAHAAAVRAETDRLVVSEALRECEMDAGEAAIAHASAVQLQAEAIATTYNAEKADMATAAALRSKPGDVLRREVTLEETSAAPAQHVDDSEAAAAEASRRAFVDGQAGANSENEARLLNDVLQDEATRASTIALADEHNLRLRVAEAAAAAEASAAEKIAEAADAAEARVAAERAINAQLILDEKAATLRRMGAVLAERVLRSMARRFVRSWRNRCRRTRLAWCFRHHSATAHAFFSLARVPAETKRRADVAGHLASLERAGAAKVALVSLTSCFTAWRKRASQRFTAINLRMKAEDSLSNRHRRLGVAAMAAAMAKGRRDADFNGRVHALRIEKQAQMATRALREWRAGARKASFLYKSETTLRLSVQFRALQVAFTTLLDDGCSRKDTQRSDLILVRWRCLRALMRWRQRKLLAASLKRNETRLKTIFAHKSLLRAVQRVRTCYLVNKCSAIARQHLTKLQFARLHVVTRHAVETRAGRVNRENRALEAGRKLCMCRMAGIVKKWREWAHQASDASSLKQRDALRRGWTAWCTAATVHRRGEKIEARTTKTMRCTALRRSFFALRVATDALAHGASAQFKAIRHFRSATSRRMLFNLRNAAVLHWTVIVPSRTCFYKSSLCRGLHELGKYAMRASLSHMAYHVYRHSSLARAMLVFCSQSEQHKGHSMIRLAVGHCETRMCIVALRKWRVAAKDRRALQELYAMAWLHCRQMLHQVALRRLFANWITLAGSRCVGSSAKLVGIRCRWRRWQRTVEDARADRLRSDSATWCLRFCEARGAFRLWASLRLEMSTNRARFRSLVHQVRDRRVVSTLATWQNISYWSRELSQHILSATSAARRAVYRRRLHLAMRRWHCVADARAKISCIAVDVTTFLSLRNIKLKMKKWRQQSDHEAAASCQFGVAVHAHATTSTRSLLRRWCRAVLATRRVRHDPIATLLARSHPASAPPANRRVVAIADALAAARRHRILAEAAEFWKCIVSSRRSLQKNEMKAARARGHRASRRGLLRWVCRWKRDMMHERSKTHLCIAFRNRHTLNALRQWGSNANTAALNVRQLSAARVAWLTFCTARWRSTCGVMKVRTDRGTRAKEASATATKRILEKSLGMWRRFSAKQRDNCRIFSCAASHFAHATPVWLMRRALRDWNYRMRACSITKMAARGELGHAARLNHYFRSLKALHRAIAAKQSFLKIQESGAGRIEGRQGTVSGTPSDGGRNGFSCNESPSMRPDSAPSAHHSATGVLFGGLLAGVLDDAIAAPFVLHSLSKSRDFREDAAGDTISATMVAAAGSVARAEALATAEAQGQDVIGIALTEGCYVMALRNTVAEADEEHRNTQEILARERAKAEVDGVRRDEQAACLASAQEQLESMSAKLEQALLQREADAAFCAAREHERRRRTAAALRAQRCALAVQLEREREVQTTSLEAAKSATRDALTAAREVTEVARTAAVDADEARQKAAAYAAEAEAATAALVASSAETCAALEAQHNAESLAAQAEEECRRESDRASALAEALAKAVRHHEIQLCLLAEEVASSEARADQAKAAAAASEVKAEIHVQQVSEAAAESIAVATRAYEEQIAHALASAASASEEADAMRGALVQAEERFALESAARAEADVRAATAERKAATDVAARREAESRASAAAEAASLARRTLQQRVSDISASHPDHDLISRYEERERAMREQCDNLSATINSLRKQLDAKAEATVATAADAHEATEYEQGGHAQRMHVLQEYVASSVRDITALREELAISKAAEAATSAKLESATTALQHPKEARRGGGLAAMERHAYQSQIADLQAELEALRRIHEPKTPTSMDSNTPSALPRPEPHLVEATPTTSNIAAHTPGALGAVVSMNNETPAVLELREALRLSEERRLAEAEDLDSQVRLTLRLHAQLQHERQAQQTCVDMTHFSPISESTRAQTSSPVMMRTGSDVSAAIVSAASPSFLPTTSWLLPGSYPPTFSPGKENSVAWCTTSATAPTSGMPRSGTPSLKSRSGLNDSSASDTRLQYGSGKHTRHVATSVARRVASDVASRGVASGARVPSNGTPRVRV